MKIAATGVCEFYFCQGAGAPLTTAWHGWWVESKGCRKIIGQRLVDIQRFVVSGFTGRRWEFMEETPQSTSTQLKAADFLDTFVDVSLRGNFSCVFSPPKFNIFAPESHDGTGRLEDKPLLLGPGKFSNGLLLLNFQGVESWYNRILFRGITTYSSLMFLKVPQSSLGILRVPRLPPPLENPPLRTLQWYFRGFWPIWLWSGFSPRVTRRRWNQKSMLRAG